MRPPAAASSRQGKPGRKKNRTAAQIRARKKARAATRARSTGVVAERSMAAVAETAKVAGTETISVAGGQSNGAMWARARRASKATPSLTFEASVDEAAGAREIKAAGAKRSKSAWPIRLHEVLRLADGDPGFEARAAAVGDSYGASVTELADIATEWADTATERTARATNQTTSATNQTTSTTNQTTSATNQTTSATNQGTASDTDLFFCIYGQNYGPSRVTVDGDYASTRQTWWVARIIDRHITELSYEYRVLWLIRKRTGRRFYQRTWEPRKVLVDDNFLEEVELVDSWKNSKVPDFTNFCKTDECGIVISADMQNLCLFHAVKHAAELVGRPDIVTSSDMDDITADELRDHGLDLTKGTTWKVFKVFLRKLRDAGRDFLYRPLVNCNFAIAGRRGARVLEEEDLYDGIYLCAACNHSFVACFCPQGPSNKRLIYDQDDGKPVQSAEWINFFSFVRPFIVFK